MIEPFFFGPRNALALYHPSADPACLKLLIICPPLFDEYQRVYKALSDLGNACAAHPRGPHVMRIDYSGTGEAFGELSDATIRDWLDDINCAIDEGRALTGAEEVILAGVRIGATIAAQCRHPAVSQYVFWDPIDTGIEYLQWLQHVNKLIEEKHRKMAEQVNLKHEDIQYVNFELNNKLSQEFKELSVEALRTERPDSVRVVTTDPEIHSSGKYHNCDFSGFEYDWPAFHEGNLTPKPVLETIAKKVLY